MTSLEKINEQIEYFILHPPNELILWGAGECGEHCLKWLASFGLENRVKGFIDSNKNKIGTKRLNLPIHPPNWLEEECSAAVIICTMFHSNVIDKIPCRENRKIFVFEDRTVAYYEGETYDITQTELYSLYRNDEATRFNLDLCAMLRKRKFGAVIPYGMVDNIKFDYWDSDEVSLLQYDKVTIIDGGAFIGDSIEHFVKTIGDKVLKLYAFESDPKNFKKLQQTIKILGISDISQVFCRGISDKYEKLNFSSNGSDGSSFEVSGTEGLMTNVVPLDDIIQEVEGKLCIKMDVEGSELKALKGASEIIRKYRPELAICVYHKYGDIIDIPKCIKSLVPEYNCILRGSPHMECYASVDRF